MFRDSITACKATHRLVQEILFLGQHFSVFFKHFGRFMKARLTPLSPAHILSLAHSLVITSLYSWKIYLLFGGSSQLKREVAAASICKNFVHPMGGDSELAKKFEYLMISKRS